MQSKRSCATLSLIGSIEHDLYVHTGYSSKLEAVSSRAEGMSLHELNDVVGNNLVFFRPQKMSDAACRSSFYAVDPSIIS